MRPSVLSKTRKPAYPRGTDQLQGLNSFFFFMYVQNEQVNASTRYPNANMDTKEKNVNSTEDHEAGPVINMSPSV